MEEKVFNDSKRPLRDLNILVPVDTAAQAQEILPLALTLAGSVGKSSVNLIGVTPVPSESSLSEGAMLAQGLRKDLEKLSDGDSRINRLAGSFVSHEPWEEIEALVEDRMQDSDLLLLPWKPDKRYLQADLSHLLNDPPCNVVVAQPAVPLDDIKRILLPVRGGPFANLSLQLALRLARASNAEITLLRVLSSNDDPMSQVLRERFTGLSDTFPEITAEVQIVGDAGTAILRELREHQAVILGASAASDGSAIGLVATLILQRKDVTALVVKTKEPFRLPLTPVRRSHLPVLVRVEKWFAENSFNYREFSDIARLMELKKKQGVRISLGLPTLNHESTIGNIIHSVKTSLIDRVPLLDEIVLIDSKSTDFTRKLAAELGVTPYIHQEILPGLGSIRGKGEALWKSLYLLKGDIVIWIDPDVTNPDARFVYGIVGPLLTDSRIKFVKGFYRSPERADGETDASEGSHVTELLARPLVNLFFPELSGIVLPLSGIYGGWRSALEQVPFYSGHGVEIGLLLDLLDRFGLSAIAQVDLGDVVRRRQNLRALSKKSFAILQVFAQHLKEKGKLDSDLTMERTMKLLRLEERQLHLDELDVHEQQRPPMIEVKEYRGRHAPRLP